MWESLDRLWLIWSNSFCRSSRVAFFWSFSSSRSLTLLSTSLISSLETSRVSRYSESNGCLDAGLFLLGLPKSLEGISSCRVEVCLWTWEEFYPGSCACLYYFISKCRQKISESRMRLTIILSASLAYTNAWSCLKDNAKNQISYFNCSLCKIQRAR